jgi:hypothetical protein
MKSWALGILLNIGLVIPRRPDLRTGREPLPWSLSGVAELLPGKAPRVEKPTLVINLINHFYDTPKGSSDDIHGYFSQLNRSCNQLDILQTFMMLYPLICTVNGFLHVSFARSLLIGFLLLVRDQGYRVSLDSSPHLLCYVSKVEGRILHLASPVLVTVSKPTLSPKPS